MSEATIDENGVIECGKYKIMDDAIFQNEYYCWRAIIWENDFEELYAVLHAWKLAQTYDKMFIAQMRKIFKDDSLYGGEACSD